MNIDIDCLSQRVFVLFLGKRIYYVAFKKTIFKKNPPKAVKL